ncbi:hypothetical protein [Okeania sp. SIO2C9]|uniref:hypothetical protein n=1 Tax=Okeania sp. SIO2C9 TaxID=2607791 RepID=UPI0025FEBE59|nr:hypothetical protein [Okeania sp. SIO2C9]
MSETTTTKPTKIEFIQYHQPGLKDGDYEINIKQEVTGEKIQANNSFTVTRTFAVSGERFDLKPKDIHAVFPPSGSLGEHSNVLPHVVLNRSTLPWERLVDTNSNNLPWLAVLLFEEGEKPEPKIITLQQLKNPQTGASKFPKIVSKDETPPTNEVFLYLESGQHEDDKVTVIDVTKQLLDKRLPTKEDLQYLAHVRQGTDDENNLVGDELAIIIGNRLPKKGSMSTVHLVSIEGRYDDTGFNFQDAGDNDSIRLVSLKSWSFSCVDEKQSFKRLLTHINRGEFLFSINNLGLIPDLNSSKTDNITAEFVKKSIALSNPTIQVDEEGILWRIINENNEQFSIEKLGDRLDIYRRESSILRLPKVDNAEAEKYLSMGYISLPHFLRQGGKTFSWYHSPLITGNNPTDNITLPIRAADELVRYNPNNGMFDISYAAAWELGRLLALQSKNFSISLYHWKRNHRHGQIIQNTESHLPFYNQSNTELPDEISSWFKDLSLLKGVPFNYLVSDERMLPRESIRFFCIDPLWIECLLDGAFSIGRVTTSDHKQDQANNNIPTTNLHKKVTGFLLRSDVVAGWPGLLVDGYSKLVNSDNAIPDEDKLKLLRMDRLSANVLICLFDGEVKTVDIHQKPETLHFGLDSDDGGNTFYKKLKDRDGRPVEQGDKNRLEMPNDENPLTSKWKDRSKNILNIVNLAEAIKNKVNFNSFTSAQFALEMIEGVEKVRFTIGTKN